MVFHAEDGRQETADIVSDGLSVTTEQDQGEPDLDRQLATSDVHFKCPNLEAAIRKVLKNPDGTITRNDLASLTKYQRTMTKSPTSLVSTMRPT